MANEQSVKATIPAGSTVRLFLPDDSSSFRCAAADLFAEELLRRLPLRIEKALISNMEAQSGAALDIGFTTLGTIPPRFAFIEPPPKIRPYPDHAEHVNLRFVQDEERWTALVLCGAESSFAFGAGALLRLFRFHGDRLEFKAEPLDMQPLTPIRGIYFTEVDKQRDGRRFMSDLLLGGGNVCGFPLPSACDWESFFDLAQCAHDWGLKNLLSISMESGYFEQEAKSRREFWRKSPPVDIVMLSHSPSPQHLLDNVGALRSLLDETGQKSDIWLEINNLSEEDLRLLFNWIGAAPQSIVKAIAYNPSRNGALIRQEAPLTMQLVSLFPLSGEAPVSIAALGKQYFESAPLTYGALGASSGDRGGLAGFAWSRFSWSPSLSLEDIFEQYGQWFFGAKAAEPMRVALMALEESAAANSAFIRQQFEYAISLVPPAMRELAQSQMDSLRLGIEGA
ncbi:MAG: hypothetical protein AB1656_07235 [Candidatus Omnitrophota bacterium]